jgi:hypothetical protein
VAVKKIRNCFSSSFQTPNHMTYLSSFFFCSKSNQLDYVYETATGNNNEATPHTPPLPTPGTTTSRLESLAEWA